MKPDVKKIIADIKATKGNRKFCNGLAGTLQDDNYASSICKYVKTVTPERIDLLIEYAEKLEAEVTDMAVQLANAESKCRDLATENAGLKKFCKDAAFDADYEAELGMERGGFTDELNNIKTPTTDAFLAEVRASGADEVSATCRGLANKDGCSVNMRCSYNLTAERAEAVSAQLRKGAAL